MNDRDRSSPLSTVFTALFVFSMLFGMVNTGSAQVVVTQDTDVITSLGGAGVYYDDTVTPPTIPSSQEKEESKDSGIISTEYALRRLQLVPDTQSFDFLLSIKNDGASDTGFNVVFANVDGTVLGGRVPMGWRLRFCQDDGTGTACQAPVVEFGPEDSNTPQTVTVPVGAAVDYHVQLFPRWDTLFNGGSINIYAVVIKTGGDNSYDVARFKATINRFDPATNALCSPFNPPPPPPQFTDTSVTLPFFDPSSAAVFAGRPALMVTQSLLTNHNGNANRRLGDVKFFYADCLLSNTAAEKALNCGTGENPSNLDTLSLLNDGGNPGNAVGLGFILSKMRPGKNNPPTGSAHNKKRRVYFTQYGAPATGLGDSYAVDNFGTRNCALLKGPLDVDDAPWLGTVNDCSTENVHNGRTRRLIAFVRGRAATAGVPFAREAQRLATADDQEFDPDTSVTGDEVMLLGQGVPVGTDWLLPDLIGSPPLIIGPPNLFTSSNLPGASGLEFDVWAAQSTQQQRPTVAYTMDNDGVLHAFLLTTFVSGTPGKHWFGGYDPSFGDAFVRELWAYVPKGALPNLKYAVGTDQHYFGDGLLRAIDIQMKDTSGNFVANTFRTVLVGHQGRAGAGVFALDVTDPETPKVFWDFGCEENSHAGTVVDGDCSDQDELAVHAAPVLGRLIDGTTERWVAVYGSGAPVSDFVDDYRSQESWVTVRDIQGGAVVKQVRVSETANDKKGNLLTDMILLRNPRSGNISALYFGDYYGAMWRVRDERLATSGASAITNGSGLVENDDLLFEPSDYGANTVAARADRPVTARPRIAIDEFRNYWTFFGSGDYVYDLNTSGSGDFDLDNNHQRFYGLQDLQLEAKYTGVGSLVDMSDQVAGTGNVNNTSWYVELGQAVTGGASGRTIAERVLDPGVVFGGLACFPTFQLPGNADRCTDEGIDRLYCLYFQNGRADVATDPRLTSSTFERSSAAPAGSPLVSVPRSGNKLPPKIFPGGPLEEVDAAVSIEAGGRRACEVLLWRDRG